INSAQIGGAKFFTQRVCCVLGHFALDHDVTAIAVEFFRNLPGRDAKFVAHHINDCFPVVEMCGVGHYRFYRNVVREDLVVRVEDHAALCVDDLLVNVFFSSKPGVFVVFYGLQINQTKRKDAEQSDESSANQHATASAVWIHLAAEGFTTGWIVSSSGDRGGIVSRTIFASEMGIIFRKPSFNRRCNAEREVNAAICALSISFWVRRLISSFSSAFLSSPR